jgi:hypothetical protein
MSTHREAGELLRWALQVNANPNGNETYRDLIGRYEDNLEFRANVQELAAGLGLRILDASRTYGMVLAPEADSPYAMRSGEYRTASTYPEDNRLLDGLIHVAIAATLYPRDLDLLGDATLVSNPVTVEGIETTLRQIVERMDEAAKGQPDPIRNGVIEAWRVYKRRQSVQETKSGRAAANTTRSMIEYALNFLCRQGCFGQHGREYRALPRYRVLVKGYAASRMHALVKKSLEARDQIEAD